MAIKACNATADDFRRAAQQHANAFWFFAVVAGLVCYFAGMWAIIPGLLALWSIVNSVGASREAMKRE